MCGIKIRVSIVEMGGLEIRLDSHWQNRSVRKKEGGGK